MTVCKVTAAQAVEIQMKFDLYLALYNEEERIFYRAFLSKNNIFHPDAEKAGEDMTLEEIIEYTRVQQMKELITKRDFFKQIPLKNQ